MQEYYFETEKRTEKNALTFAYVWPLGDDASTRPPIKSFHSLRDNDDDAFRRVAKRAYKWIVQNGTYVNQPKLAEALALDVARHARETALPAHVDERQSIEDFLGY